MKTKLRFLILGFGLLLLLQSLFILLPKATLAAGEKYQWSGKDIKGSRGYWSETTTFSKDAGGPESAAGEYTNDGKGHSDLCGTTDATGGGFKIFVNDDGKSGQLKGWGGCKDKESPPGPGPTSAITISGTPPAGAGSGGGGGSGSHDENPTCETTKGSQLSWVLCPIINGVADFSDWVFTKFLEPSLKNVPISAETTSPTYKIWSNFRLFGNVVLIGGVLALVFAQAAGGSILDAYAVRKIAPRLLVATIAVNLSLYLAVGVSEAIKLIGLGIGQLITAPLKDAGNFNFEPRADTAFPWKGLIFALGAIGVTATAAFVWRDVGKKIFGSSQTGSFGGELLHVVLFGVFITLLLTVIGIFFTVIIRQGLLIFLSIISPVAIALYVLPGTERFARQWWSLFTKTLFVYPIITGIFAIADVLGTLILQNNKSITGVLTGITVLFMPLFLIPFAFKFAGGAIATIYGAATNGMNRINNSGFLKSRREEGKRRLGYKVGQSREKTGEKLAETINEGDAARERLNKNEYTKDAAGRAKRREDQKLARSGRLAGFRKSMVTGTGFEIAQAKRTAQEKEIMNLIRNNANDAALRAQTVDKDFADSDKAKKGDMADSRIDEETGMRMYMQEDGTEIAESELDRRTKEDGTHEYQTAGGAWVTAADIAQSDRTFGRGNRLAYQAALEYEMNKARTPEQKRRIYDQFRRDVDRFGWSDGEATGAWMAAAFNNQDHDISFKNSNWKTGGLITTDTAADVATPSTFDPSKLDLASSLLGNTFNAAGEAKDKKGNWQLSNMDQQFFEDQAAGTTVANNVLDTEDDTRAAIDSYTFTSDEKGTADEKRAAARRQVDENVQRARSTLALQKELAEHISLAGALARGGPRGGVVDPEHQERGTIGESVAAPAGGSVDELRKTYTGVSLPGSSAATETSATKFHDNLFKVGKFAPPVPHMNPVEAFAKTLGTGLAAGVAKQARINTNLEQAGVKERPVAPVEVVNPKERPVQVHEVGGGPGPDTPEPPDAPDAPPDIPPPPSDAPVYTGPTPPTDTRPVEGGPGGDPSELRVGGGVEPPAASAPPDNIISLDSRRPAAGGAGTTPDLNDVPEDDNPADRAA